MMANMKKLLFDSRSLKYYFTPKPMHFGLYLPCCSSIGIIDANVPILDVSHRIDGRPVHRVGKSLYYSFDEF